MPSSTRYPDALRQQAIALHRQGKGYKAIGHELDLPRDTVRVPETRKAGAKRASSAPRFMFLWTPGAKSADFAPGSLVLRETVKTEGIEGVCLQYLPSVKEKKKNRHPFRPRCLF